MPQILTPFSRRDLIVKDSIKIKHDVEDIIAKIIHLGEISNLENLDETTKTDNLEKLHKEIRKFWNRIDEIGFLSNANLIDKTVMVYLFQMLQDARLNAIESCFIKMMYDGCIKTFAKKALKISNTDNINTIQDIDIKLRGKVVKKQYPLIWHFVKHCYKEPLSKKLFKIKKYIQNYYSKICLTFAKCNLITKTILK